MPPLYLYTSTNTAVCSVPLVPLAVFPAADALRQASLSSQVPPPTWIYPRWVHECLLWTRPPEVFRVVHEPTRTLPVAQPADQGGFNVSHHPGVRCPPQPTRITKFCIFIPPLLFEYIVLNNSFLKHSTTKTHFTCKTSVPDYNVTASLLYQCVFGNRLKHEMPSTSPQEEH